MNLEDRLKEDLKDAMKRRDDVRVRTIRMILATVKNLEVEKGGKLSEDEMLEALNKEAKKRREAIEQYRKGGREDLAEMEEKELEVITSYLPAQMSDEEIERLAQETIEKLEAKSLKDLGKVMKEIMPKVKGRADGRKVNEIVRKLLG